MGRTGQDLHINWVKYSRDFLLLFAGIEPCAVGSTVEVLINPHHAARPELLEVSKSQWVS